MRATAIDLDREFERMRRDLRLIRCRDLIALPATINGAFNLPR